MIHHTTCQLPLVVIIGDRIVATLEVAELGLDCEDVDEFAVDLAGVIDAAAGVGETFALPAFAVQNAVAIARLGWAASCVWAWT